MTMGPVSYLRLLEILLWRGVQGIDVTGCIVGKSNRRHSFGRSIDFLLENSAKKQSIPKEAYKALKDSICHKISSKIQEAYPSIGYRGWSQPYRSRQKHIEVLHAYIEREIGQASVLEVVRNLLPDHRVKEDATWR